MVIFDMQNKEFLEIRTQVISILKEIFDPEIPINIWDLGIIYGVDVQNIFQEKNGKNPNLKKAIITMTLTSPNCPAIDSLPLEIEQKVKTIKEIEEVKINLVWEPSWNESLMTEEAKLELGIL
jgi:metal-sulfur cluster biosynthetic enzyme